MLRYGAYLGIGAAAVSIIGLLVPRLRSKALVLALLMGLAAVAPPLLFLQQARAVPPINDIATDSDDPRQREAYPDIQPILLPEPREKAFERAAAAAQVMGWEIVVREPAAGRIEAVDTTPWFGFKDDVTVRITATPAGSRIDVRSKSRVGRGDVGTNAKRIRGFRAELGK